MTQIFENLNDKAQNILEPIGKVNKAVVSNLNALFDIHSKSISAYTELGLDQAKAAMEIRNTESLTAFVKQQSEMAENVQAQFKGDIEKMSELASKTSKDISGAFTKEPAE
jgi:phasin family protein